jgi:hypothetical protein
MPGAYVLADPPGGKPGVILIASGSEVSLCVNATSSSSPRASARARSRCRLGIFSNTRRRRTGTACCRPRSPRARGRAGFDLRLGTLRRRFRPRHRHENIRRSAPLKELLRKYGFEPQRVTEVARELLGSNGTTVILSDGDAVFQPCKVERSGLWHASTIASSSTSTRSGTLMMSSVSTLPITMS